MILFAFRPEQFQFAPLHLGRVTQILLVTTGTMLLAFYDLWRKSDLLFDLKPKLWLFLGGTFIFVAGSLDKFLRSRKFESYMGELLDQFS